MSQFEPRPERQDVVADVAALCEQARRITAGGPLEDHVRQIADRLEGPLRIAIAGRVKAGKSTLLNALVGERLAATDAGECTKVVTTYRHAPGYEVAAHLHDGSIEPLRFTREDGALRVDLGTVPSDRIARIDVGWPARILHEITLIDTPGLESLNDDNSQRTRAFLDHSGTNPAGADAVIYLMRHMHRSDAEFLGSFMDRTVAGASPVNAMAVLSRADEIGACRLDAMESARRIADRYAADPAVRTLVAAVLPVAGLLAETGLTLGESEYASLARLTAMPDGERARLLLSVDDFCDIELSPLTAEIRRDLVERLGMFGVRRAINAMSERSVESAGDLSRALVDVSGVAALHAAIRDRFLPRARLLQARTALVALRGVAAALVDQQAPEAGAFGAQVDRTDASAIEFSMLQAAHLVLSGAVRLDASASSEVAGLLDTTDLDTALGLSELGGDARQQAALVGLGRWRQIGTDPLANSLSTAVADTMARLFERAYTAGVRESDG